MHRSFASVSTRLPSGMPMGRKKDTESIQRLSLGEPTAWAQLVDDWSPCLYNYLLHNAVSEVEAPKLMHVIFSEVVQAFVGSLQETNLAVLIFGITYHHVLHYRQQHRDLMGKKRWLPVASDQGEQAKASNFFHGFQQFPPDVQQILLLRYFYGVSLPEISQIVGQSETLLTKTLAQAKHLLQ